MAREGHGRLFPAVDGLRAVAALLVVSWHAGLGHLSWLGGWAGVPIFFVLSGYLITRLAVHDESASGFSFRAFWIRRITRIFPLYYLAVALFALFPLIGSGGGRELRAAWPYYLTFNGEYAPNASMVISWSLGIEEKFYLFWPVIAFLVLRRSRLRIPVAAAGAIGAFMLEQFSGLSHAGPYGAILVGCVTALLERENNWPRLSAPLRSAVAGWIIAVALAGVLLQAQGSLHRFVYVLLSPLVSLFIVHLVDGASPVRRLLSTRLMRYVGRRSFGLYLFHTFALGMAARVVTPGSLPRDVVVGSACLIGGLAMAEIGHRWIEQPMIDRGRTMATRVNSDNRTPRALSHQNASARQD
jgi:peptidoglycan/LPS O-acetylase OafA/YrhL